MSRSPRPPWALRSRFVYPTFHRFMRGLLRLFCRVEYGGTRHLPEKGPLILAANHQSYIDPFLIGTGIKLRPRYLVYTTFMHMPVVGTFCRAFGGLEVGHGPPARSLRLARYALNQGDVLEVFPEGGRSPDSTVLPFARGFAQLARLTGAPVVPVAIVGADYVWPPARRLPRPGPVRVHYGAPLSHHAATDLNGAAGREADRLFAARVRRAVLALGAGGLQPGEDTDAKPLTTPPGETG